MPHDKPLHHRILHHRTSHNVQRVIAVAAISIISFVGLESLVYIANLYQPQVFLEASLFIYLIMIIWLHFLFDLHLREDHTDAKSIVHAIGLRFKHFASWENLRYFQNYLILPGLIYWATIVLVAINFNHIRLQQYITVVSSICLIVCYTFFKEVFHSRFAPLKNSHFVILAYVKLYAAWIVYAAALGIVWYYCQGQYYYHLIIFVSTFMLMYQALFQFSRMKLESILHVFLISAFVAVASFFVYKQWNVNYFSAGLFLTAIYNFLWTIFFHYTNKTLTREIMIEQVAILVLLMIMVFGTTNFRSQIGRC